MDEPTTALDVVIQREILEQLMDLRERFGFTIIFITHDLSLLIELADTIAVMYAGHDRGEGAGPGAVPGAAASVHTRAVELVPGPARSARDHDRHQGLAAGSAARAVRLPVPSALRVRAAGVLDQICAPRVEAKGREVGAASCTTA